MISGVVCIYHDAKVVLIIGWGPIFPLSEASPNYFTLISLFCIFSYVASYTLRICFMRRVKRRETKWRFAIVTSFLVR